jgi:hypothetical protein
LAKWWEYGGYVDPQTGRFVGSQPVTPSYGGQQQQVTDGYLTPGQAQPTRRTVTYWEDPKNVVAQYNAMKRLGVSALPKDVDPNVINTAYQYFKWAYQNAPDYTWSALPDQDPGNEYLRQLATPSVTNWWEQPQPNYQVAEPSRLTPIVPEPAANLSPTEKMLQRIFSSPLVQSPLAKAAAAQEEGEPEPWFVKLLKVINIPYELTEQTVGLGTALPTLLYQQGKAKGLEGIGDVLSNLDNLWRAGRYTMESNRDPSEIFLPFTALPTRNATTDSLLDIYETIKNNPNITTEQMDEAMLQKYGIEGMGRDIVGSMVLDPLNAFGLVAKGVTKPLVLNRIIRNPVAREMLDVAFKGSGGGVFEGLQKYGTLMRGEPGVESMDNLTRWLTGVTKAGDQFPLKIMQASDAATRLGGKLGKLNKPLGIAATTAIGGGLGYLGFGPIGGLVGAAMYGPQGARGLSYLLNLSPQARATELTNIGANGATVLLSRAKNADEAYRISRSLAKMDIENAGELSMKFMDAPEGKAIGMMYRGLAPTVDNLQKSYIDTAPQRALLDTIAQATGKETHDILKQIGDAGNADILARQFSQATGQAITGKTLQDAFDLFIKDGKPYNDEMAKHELYVAMIEHANRYATDIIGVKPDTKFNRLGQAIKAAQSFVLLGLNPVYVMNNFIDNVASMAATGVMRYNSPTELREFWRRMGINPERLRAGFGPASAGGEELLKDAYRPLREAITAGDNIDKTTNAIQNLSGRIGIFSRMAGKIEQASSAQAMTTAARQFWNSNFDRVIPSVPPELKAMLDRIDPDLARVLDMAVRGGMNPKEVTDALQMGYARATVDSFIPELAQRYGLDSGLLRDKLDAFGATDFIREKLNAKPNMTDQELHGVFSDLHKKIRTDLNEQHARELPLIEESAFNDVTGQGVQSAVYLSDQAMIDMFQTRSSTLTAWGDLFRQLDEQYVAPDVRAEMIRRQRELVDEQYTRYRERDAARLEGIRRAMGYSDQSKSWVERRIKQHDNWNTFHKQKEELYAEFFKPGKWKDKSESSAAWKILQQQVQQLYNQVSNEDLRLQGEMDAIAVRLTAEQMQGHPLLPQIVERVGQWRTRMLADRQKMYEETLRFHDDLNNGNYNYEQRRALQEQFYQGNLIPMYGQRMQSEIDELNAIVRATGGQADTTPTPDVPQGPPPSVPNVDPIADDLARYTDETLVEFAGKTQAEYVAEAQALQNVTTARQVATEYGVTGQAQDIVLANIIRKYGPQLDDDALKAEAQVIIDAMPEGRMSYQDGTLMVGGASPDLVRAVLEKRKQLKGAAQEVQEATEATLGEVAEVPEAIAPRPVEPSTPPPPAEVVQAVTEVKRREVTRKPVKTKAQAVKEAAPIATASPDFPQELLDKIASEKPGKWGYTKTQVEYIAKALVDKANTFADNEARIATLASKAFEDVTLDDFGGALIIDVPGGGRINITTVRGLNNAHKAITGKPIPRWENVPVAKVTRFSSGKTALERQTAIATDYQDSFYAAIRLYGTPEAAATAIRDQLSRNIEGVDTYQAQRVLEELDRTVAMGPRANETAIENAKAYQGGKLFQGTPTTLDDTIPPARQSRATIRAASLAAGEQPAVVDATMAIWDSIANWWAKQQPGRTPDDWYAERLAGVQRGVGGTLQQAETLAPTFYSHLGRTVEQKMANRMDAQALRSMLANNGVKPDELKWTGLDEFLEAKTTVTKKEVQEWLAQNEVRVEEVVADQATKYTSYTLPGGQNYRELLLTLPPPKSRVSSEYRVVEMTYDDGSVRYFATGPNHRSNAMRTRAEAEAELARIVPDYEKIDINNQSYQSPHWSEPNVLAHVRFDDRVDADGKRVLFIEEIQSDWHQAGREKGYAKTKITEDDLPPGYRLERADVSIDMMEQELEDSNIRIVQSEGGRWRAESNNGTLLNGRHWENRADAIRDAYQGTGPEIKEGTDLWIIRDKYDMVWASDSSKQAVLDQLKTKVNEGAVPPAPFAKTWPDLAMKRMIRWASENGYDRIAWTTGKQQAERYNLAKQVDSITSQRLDDGRFTIEAHKGGRSRQYRLLERTVSATELPDIVGKELAEKIVNSGDTINVWQGDDLAVGGYGMRGFYDEILPATVQKYIKKWGGKVGETDVVNKATVGKEKAGSWYVDYVASDVSNPRRWFATEAEAKAFANNQGLSVHSFDITPEMRKSALLGQPLFQKTRGAVDFLSDGRAMIYLMNSDPSTWVHETAHIFRRDLQARDMDTVIRWLRKDHGLKVTHQDGRFVGAGEVEYRGRKMGAAEAAEEYFATGFEQYLREGVAPNKALARVFEQFKTWMASVYARLRGDPLVKLNDEMRELFARVLDGSDEVSVEGGTVYRGNFPTAEGAPNARWFETDNGPSRLLHAEPDGTYNYQRNGGEIDRLYQDDAPDMISNPMGTVANPEPLRGEGMDEFYNERLLPLLNDLEMGMTGPKAKVTGSFNGRTLDPESQRAVTAYLEQVYNAQGDLKMGALRHGEQRRDFALLNYSRRYGWDNLAQTAYPYEFWYTRSALKWAMLALDKPAILANYARLRNMMYEMDKQEGFPRRLMGKMKIPLPFSVPWLGNGIYVDPLRQFFPMANIIRPFEAASEKATEVERAAEYTVMEMVADGQISEKEATTAMTTHTGQVWQDAMAKAAGDVEGELANPFDFVQAMVGTSLPLSWGRNLAAGKENWMSELPATRLIKSVTSLVKPGGVNIEAPFRKALGLPVDGNEFWGYYVDRELANMAALGEVEVQEALDAMMTRQGDAYTKALSRVGKYQAARNIFGSVFLDFFPEGEQRQRSLMLEFSKAAEAGKLTDFFDKYPEYEARMLQNSFDDPEERLRRYMRSRIWERYYELPELQRKIVADDLGDLFKDAFLNKSTRSYDSIKTDTLQYWAQRMEAHMPDSLKKDMQEAPIEMPEQGVTDAYGMYKQQRDAQFPGIYEIQNLFYTLPPAMQERIRGEFPQLSEYYRWRDRQVYANPELAQYVAQEEYRGLDPALVKKIMTYRVGVEDQFPGFLQMQDEYYAQPDGVSRRSYLAQHPILKAAWDWKRFYLAQNPEIVTYVKSDEYLVEGVLGKYYQSKYNIDQWQAITPEQFSPALSTQLMGYFFAGQPLTGGAKSELRMLWERAGRPGGNYDWYVQNVIGANLYGVGQ